ncbi:MAG: hypothetical protein HY741_14690 [Chloroflexi bacterium]|nr:hypothetical protein [Chloroflexota bacterium]
MNDNTKPAKENAKPAKADAKVDANETSAPETPAVEPGAMDDAPLLESSSVGALSADADAAKPVQTEPAAAEPPSPTPAREPEPLRLPRGAFLALRKSGGLQFSTRVVVLYPDGRAAYDERGASQKEYKRLPRVLNDGQVLSLRKLLDQTNFWRAESSGAQNPDAFAYELAARLGQRSNTIQVFEGSIPEKIKPLVERLTPLLPREEA